MCKLTFVCLWMCVCVCHHTPTLDYAGIRDPNSVAYTYKPALSSLSSPPPALDVTAFNFCWEFALFSGLEIHSVWLGKRGGICPCSQSWDSVEHVPHVWGTRKPFVATVLMFLLANCAACPNSTWNNRERKKGETLESGMAENYKSGTKSDNRNKLAWVMSNFNSNR